MKLFGVCRTRKQTSEGEVEPLTSLAMTNKKNNRTRTVTAQMKKTRTQHYRPAWLGESSVSAYLTPADALERLCASVLRASV